MMMTIIRKKEYAKNRMRPQNHRDNGTRQRLQNPWISDPAKPVSISIDVLFVKIGTGNVNHERAAAPIFDCEQLFLRRRTVGSGPPTPGAQLPYPRPNFSSIPPFFPIFWGVPPPKIPIFCPHPRPSNPRPRPIFVKSPPTPDPYPPGPRPPCPPPRS